MYCIETKELSYHFSNEQQVLDKINLQVPESSVFGFLGPNGAGKTTTLRLLLGLLRKQSGEISFFGKSFEKDRIGILRNTGSLIESPSFYGQLSAAENLLVLQKIYRVPKQRIYEVLAIVGLADTGTKKAAKFSLGMKQRLSIAIAILHQPSLLILDEPTNGLDPNGIIEMRELLKKLNRDSGMTILISSHLLAEIEKLVTHIGIIHHGKMLFQGTMSELHTNQNLGSTTRLETNSNQRAAEILQLEGYPAINIDGVIQTPMIEKQQLARINQQLVSEGIEVYQIHNSKNDLESIFIDMVRN